MKPSDSPPFHRDVRYVMCIPARTRHERWTYDAWLRGELEQDLAADFDAAEDIVSGQNRC